MGWDADLEWRKTASGEACHLCNLERTTLAEYRYLVAQMATATLYLKTDQRYRGACVLVYAKRHAQGLDHLEAEEAATHMRDVHAASRAIAAAVGAEHMNHLTLGNMMPHLHWHIIPRRRDDGRWGRPHWDQPERELPDPECRALVEEIRSRIGR